MKQGDLLVKKWNMMRQIKYTNSYEPCWFYWLEFYQVNKN